MQSLLSNSFLILSILVFATVLLMLKGLHMIWTSYRGEAAKRLAAQLRALSASSESTADAKLLKQRMLSDIPALDRLLLELPRAHRLQRFIHQAGLNWTVSRLLMSCILLFGTVYTVLSSIFIVPLILALAGASLLALSPLIYVHRKRDKRMRKLEQQLPDALDLMTRALRSGHAFSSSLHMVGEEMAEPIADEFRIVHDEINFGVSLQQALMNLGTRVPVTDLRYFIVAVLIQRESGGNLTEVLSNLSRLIRDRLKLMAKVKVLSAEGRMSAWILGVMPFLLGAMMHLLNPKFMAPLFNDSIGTTIMQYTLALMAVGILILIKIVKIRV